MRVVGCSNDIVEIAPQGFNFVTVAWTVPSAVDQFNNILTGQSAIEPGNYFEVGTTTRITYNFMDNFGNTAVCSFLVTVQCTCFMEPLIYIYFICMWHLERALQKQIIILV